MQRQRKNDIIDTTAATAPDTGAGQEEASETHMPRNLSFAENLVLTLKVLGGAGLVISALWILSRWTSTS